MMALPDFDPSKLYGIKYDTEDVFLVYPTGAVRLAGPKEWAELEAAKVPLIQGGNSEKHRKAIEQEAWTSRGYVRQPGQ